MRSSGCDEGGERPGRGGAVFFCAALLPSLDGVTRAFSGRARKLALLLAAELLLALDTVLTELVELVVLRPLPTRLGDGFRRGCRLAVEDARPATCRSSASGGVDETAIGQLASSASG